MASTTFQITVANSGIQIDELPVANLQVQPLDSQMYSSGDFVYIGTACFPFDAVTVPVTASPSALIQAIQTAKNLLPYYN